MKKVVKASLSLFLISSLIACGSKDDNKQSENTATETPTATVIPTPEPEPIKIELNDDNWQEYFELKRVLFLHPDSDSYEEGEYYSGFSETLILKDEYQTKLSGNDASVITFTFEAPRGMYYATLSGDNLEIGDEIDIYNCDLSNHYHWDFDLLTLWQQQLNVLKKDTITITNEEIINGKAIVNYGFMINFVGPFTYTDERGQTINGYKNASGEENVWGTAAPKGTVISDVSGTLFLYE